MNVSITGGTGFIGSAAAKRLLESGMGVKALARAGSRRPDWPGIRWVSGDLENPDALGELAAGSQALVHCAAVTSEGAAGEAVSRRINVEGTRRLIEACLAAGCARFIHISSQSARPDNPSPYGKTKWLSEELVRKSALGVTILRPSTVYGPGGRGLFAKIAGHVRRLPVFPIIGRACPRFRPVHVDDVAQAVVSCLRSEATVGRTYDLGGADAVTFEEFVKAVAAALGRPLLTCRLPLAPCLAGARLASRLLKNPPLTVDNIIGLTQMQACDNGPAQRDFGFAPVGLKQGLFRTFS